MSATKIDEFVQARQERETERQRDGARERQRERTHFGSVAGEKKACMHLVCADLRVPACTCMHRGEGKRERERVVWSVIVGGIAGIWASRLGFGP